jgi:hypothetical protein
MKNENMFREKLYHHTVPVREGLWDAIEAQLPPEKKRKAFPLFWFTLFGTTLLGAAVMIGIFNRKISGQPMPEKHASTPALITSNLSETPTGTEPSSLSTTSPLSTTSTSTLSSNTTTTTLSSTTGSSSTSKSRSSETSASKTRIADSSGRKKTPKATTPTSKGQIRIKENPANLHNQSLSKGTIADPTLNTELATGTNAGQAYISELSLLPNLQLEEIFHEDELPGLTEPASEISSVKPDPNCYKFSGPGSQFAITADILGGPGFSPKSFEQNSSEYSVYADARNATENYQYAWSAGARINLHHRSGLKGSIGFLYTQAGDVFDYTDSLATQSTTRIDSFFAADGTFLYAETSQVLILGTLIKKIHNTYKYVDIPLLVGYEMPMGRSSLLLHAGPVINLTTTQEGQILDPMLHPRYITEGEPGAIDVYKTNLGMSLYLGAAMMFPLTDHLSWLIEPSLLYRLNPVSLDSYPLKEHRHYAGLNVGLRYHFK